MRSEVRALRSRRARRGDSETFWRLYEQLAAEVPPALQAEGFAAGLHWFGVRAGGAIGLAMAPRDGHDAPSGSGGVAGTPLAELVPLARSWNLADAALGIAALNAALNHPKRVRAWTGPHGLTAHPANAFVHFQPRLVGKRVAVIGHFRALEPLARICDLTILERRPQPGDLPDPACEVVLPRSDYVFITATTLINKTLPRLLALSRGAAVVIVGPTTPLSPVWFEFGVTAIAGLCVEDAPASWQRVQEGGRLDAIAQGGRMLVIERV